MSIIRRSKTYYIKRRVPVRYARVEERPWYVTSLKTDSLREAEAKAAVVWENCIQGWEARLAGRSDDAIARFEAARDLAQTRGFAYLPAAQTAKRPLAELVDRVEAIPDGRDARSMRVDAAAMLGLAKTPQVSITSALEIYWGLAEERAHGKDPNQMRIWRNQRKRAVANFLEVIGDLAIDQINRDNMLDYRQWWWERIRDEGLTANSANKDISTLVSILRTVNEMKRLNLDLPVERLAFSEGEQNTRLPFSDEWILDHILRRGALNAMNDQARGILLVMINTGCRPAEIAGLLPHHIHLDDPYPHISIEPEGRQLKTAQSRRKIPLVGVSLKAIKAHTDGFPRYRANGSLSATINKFMRENGLMQSENHSMYGLRHSFEDRLLAAGVDERIRADLMGHKLKRERYGAGATLQHSTEILQSIAF